MYLKLIVFNTLINMDLDKYGCFMQDMFIIIETLVNIDHEDETCFKGHRCFSKNLFKSIRHMKKERT